MLNTLYNVSLKWYTIILNSLDKTYKYFYFNYDIKVEKKFIIWIINLYIN